MCYEKRPLVSGGFVLDTGGLFVPFLQKISLCTTEVLCFFKLFSNLNMKFAMFQKAFRFYLVVNILTSQLTFFSLENNRLWYSKMLVKVDNGHLNSSILLSFSTQCDASTSHILQIIKKNHQYFNHNHMTHSSCS